MIVIVLAEQRVQRHIPQHIVHPAHVPFEIESQPAVGGGAGYQRPCGGFLRNHHHLRVMGKHTLVQPPQKGDRLQILLAAVLVGHPFAVPTVIVEIQHGCHRIHPNAVRMILFQPEQHVGDQEILHLCPTVIEHTGAPFAMLPLARVGVFVARTAVKPIQPAFVFGEMRRHPIQNHADARLVAHINKMHKLVRRAVARGGGVIPGHLIPP